MQISCVDISRAYFQAKVDKENPLYVQLPSEDPDFGTGQCGRLNVHMYGNRPVADGWYTEYSSTINEFGFKTGVSSACVFACFGPCVLRVWGRFHYCWSQIQPRQIRRISKAEIRPMIAAEGP